MQCKTCDGSPLAQFYDSFHCRSIDPLQPVQQAAMSHQHLRIGVCQHVLQNRAAIGRIERHEHAAQVIDRIERDQRLAPVGQPHRNMVAAHHTKLLQPGRLAHDKVAQLRISPMTAILEHGINRIRLRHSKIVEQVSQHTLAPVQYARITLSLDIRHARLLLVEPSSAPW
jgi:hypothetical protein